MAASQINSVVIAGNLTRDPELRSTPSGTSVCKLRIANNRSFKGSDGQWSSRPNYFDVTCWGRLGENVAQYMAKGRAVCVMGELRWREWDADDGTKRSAVEINAREVQFLGDGSGGGGGGQRQNEPPLEDDPYGGFSGGNGDGGSVPESDVPPDMTDLPTAGATAAAAADDDDIPFARPRMPDMEFGPERRRDLFVGDRWLA